MKKINQKSLNQRGDTFEMVRNTFGDAVNIKYLFGCMNFLELDRQLKKCKYDFYSIPHSLKITLRTGFGGVKNYGFNNYIDKSIYS